MAKTLMFGIDGGTWTVIRPMMEKGELPNLTKLTKEGASGKLRTMRPAASPMLWTTIATGKVPEKHGVQLFGDTSKTVRCKRIWNFYEDMGHPVGLCGYLMTWPPDIANGFMIPDLFALGPDTQPPELKFLQEFTLSQRRTRGAASHSAGYYVELARKMYQCGVSASTLASALGFMARKTLTNLPPKERFWRKGLVQPQIYADVFARLYQEYHPVYAGFHFHLTDTLSHKYWRYLFPEDFADVPEEDVARYGQVIPTAYRLADEILGRFLGLLDEDTTVVVLSDHGFGPMDPDPVPILNIKLVMKTIDVPDYLVPMRIGRRWYLTSKDRQNKGVPQHVIDRLSAAYIEETGAPLFGVTEFPGYIRLRLPRYRVDLSGTGVFPELASYPLSELLKYDTEKVNSGAHHDDGIVIVHGKSVKAGVAIEGMGLLDVVPTLLALDGLPVAKDMDGQVKIEAIDEAFLRTHPIKYIDSYEEDENSADEGPEGEMTAEEREKVMGRLEALGYL